MHLRQTLAENLKRERRMRGWSQEEYADRARIDRTYVSAIERCRYSVTIDVLEKLATALELDPAELIRASGSLVNVG